MSMPSLSVHGGTNSPSVSIQAHVIRRMSTESTQQRQGISMTSTEAAGNTSNVVRATITSPPILNSNEGSNFTLSYRKNSEDASSKLSISLGKHVPALKDQIRKLQAAKRVAEKCKALGKIQS